MFTEINSHNETELKPNRSDVVECLPRHKNVLMVSRYSADRQHGKAPAGGGACEGNRNEFISPVCDVFNCVLGNFHDLMLLKSGGLISLDETK